MSSVRDFFGSSRPNKKSSTCDAAVSQDLGSHITKATICHTRGEDLWAIRVALSDGAKNMRKKHSPGALNNIYESVGVAALDVGTGSGCRRLITGPEALDKDVNFSLKTILMHVAGATRREHEKPLPDEPDLLDYVSRGVITREMEIDVLQRHFRHVYRATMAKAKNCSPPLRIIKLVLTYPNFLDDFLKYIGCYAVLIKPIWGNDIYISWMSEGQATVLSVCASYEDPAGSCRRNDLVEELYGDLPTGENAMLNLVCVDGGSSSVNLQVQSVYLDAERNIVNSQSNVSSDWHTGARGGSHLANTLVKPVIRHQLQSLHESEHSGSEVPCLPEGVIAHYEQQFEEKKWCLNYRSAEPLILVGPHPAEYIQIEAEDVLEIFRNALENGIKVVEDAVTQVMELQRDFAIVFTGGSYRNIWLRNEVENIMLEIQTQAHSKGLWMRFAFLSDFVDHDTSTVSLGAAVSAMRPLSTPAEVLDGSAVGIQRLFRPSPSSKEWVGDPRGDFLFSKGCGTPVGVEYSVQVKRAKPKFSLVCDPNYFAGDSVVVGQSFTIGWDEDVLNGPLSVYDLGFVMSVDNLPRGILRFRVHGRSMSLLTKDGNDGDGAGSEPSPSGASTSTNSSEDHLPQLSRRKQIPFLLSCCKVKKRGGPAVYHPLNTIWKMTLETDPASNLLVIGHDVLELAANCFCCENWLGTRFWVCQECEKSAVCPACHQARNYDGDHTGHFSNSEHLGHTFSLVTLHTL